MTTGEYLVSKSSLTSGTALAHLLAMQTGGLGTAFASMFSVRIDEPTLSLVQQESPQVVRSNFPGPAITTSAGGSATKEVSVMTKPLQLCLSTPTVRLFVNAHREDIALVCRFGNEAVVKDAFEFGAMNGEG